MKALGCCPQKTDKRGEGRRDIVIDVGGTSVLPGDHIYADRNGVLVSRVALIKD
ncbi:MAG: hypothetical protein AAGL66_09720 [Pseudomonadota bacterium]